MVVTFYLFSHITADNASKDAAGLHRILERHDENCGDASTCHSCILENYRFFLSVAMRKWMATEGLHSLTVEVLRAALGGLSNEDTADKEDRRDNDDDDGETVGFTETVMELFLSVNERLRGGNT